MSVGVLELIPLVCTQPAGDPTQGHKPVGRQSLLCARPAVTSPAAEHHRLMAGDW